jgi:hypothetical protein
LCISIYLALTIQVTVSSTAKETSALLHTAEIGVVSFAYLPVYEPQSQVQQLIGQHIGFMRMTARILSTSMCAQLSHIDASNSYLLLSESLGA